MPKVSLSRVRSIGEPVHSNDWRFELLSIPQPVRQVSGIGPGDSLDPQAVSMDFPRMQVPPQELTHRGLTINIPSPVDLERQISITFLETRDLRIVKLFESWRAMVSRIALPVSYSPDGTYEGLKGSFSLTLLSRDHKPLLYMIFQGVYVLSMDMGQASEAKGADLIRPVVSFSYDYFYYDFKA